MQHERGAFQRHYSFNKGQYTFLWHWQSPPPPRKKNRKKKYIDGKWGMAGTTARRSRTKWRCRDAGELKFLGKENKRSGWKNCFQTRGLNSPCSFVQSDDNSAYLAVAIPDEHYYSSGALETLQMVKKESLSSRRSLVQTSDRLFSLILLSLNLSALPLRPLSPPFSSRPYYIYLPFFFLGSYAPKEYTHKTSRNCHAITFPQNMPCANHRDLRTPSREWLRMTRRKKNMIWLQKANRTERVKCSLSDHKSLFPVESVFFFSLSRWTAIEITPC